MRRSRAIVAGVAVVALLVYAALISQTALALLRSGQPVGVGLGVVAFVFPVLTLWFIAREVMLARAVDRLTATLAGEDALEIDDLPRSPGGRIDRAVARERFEPARAAVDENPEEWRGWYRLGWAYDAAGDRRRAREALRYAVRLERRETEGPG